MLITIIHLLYIFFVVPSNTSGKTGPSRVSNTTVKCFVTLMFYGKGNGEVLKAPCIALVTNRTKNTNNANH